MKISVNLTIMDYAKKYVYEQKLKNNILTPINQMRIWKGVYLPCELVGVNGREMTKVFCEVNGKSSIEWKFQFEKVPNPSNKTNFSCG